ncbi:MAG: helix-turn-helix domain-containing protein [Thermodesulfobacteriota bacterium]
MSPEDIKRIRLRLGWSQERFARELGVSFSTVNRWERGRTVPSPMALKALRRLGGGRPDVDRRKAVRLKKRFPLTVSAPVDEASGTEQYLRAVTEDISVTGAMFKALGKVMPGQKVLIGLSLDDGATASMPSEVVWTDGRGGGGAGGNAGVRFDKVTSSEMMKVVNAMLR